MALNSRVLLLNQTYEPLGLSRTVDKLPNGTVLDKPVEAQ